MKNIALLGVGTMGLGMGKNLLKGGFSLTAWNRTRSRAEPLAVLGGRLADTPAEAAAAADVIISMLADEEASREVWLGPVGALDKARPGAILIECSTVTPEWIAELHTAAGGRSLQLLDAPVTGSRAQAEAGALTFLVGGETSGLDGARLVLEAMSRSVLHVGPSGSGARLKLINNFLCGVQAASLAEAVSWIERSGLNRDQALAFLTKAAPGSPLLTGLSERMVAATYEVNFLLPLMEKDLRYAQQDAAHFGLDLRTAAVAESRFQDAVRAGLTKQDMSAVIEPLRVPKSQPGQNAA